MSEPLRLGFAGTPAFAATILSALLDSEHRVVLVLTQPDRHTGRGRRLAASPVKSLALQHGVPVKEPATLRGFSIRGANLDLLVVAAYGLSADEALLRVQRAFDTRRDNNRLSPETEEQRALVRAFAEEVGASRR